VEIRRREGNRMVLFGNLEIEDFCGGIREGNMSPVYRYECELHILLQCVEI
jgi:hypothetical protein